ncbi:MAG: metallophosphoesterase [Butyrivibrio crossotus]|nr:metallophosphoesterase [Butyrivibrio crossotus]
MHYVIGDVHGCYDELITLVNKIENKDKDARFIFVGDWVDRGQKVYDTLLWMRDHITENGKYQSVLGNHDIDALDWWNNQYLPFREKNPDIEGKKIPITMYDFSDVVAKDFQHDIKAIQSVMDTYSRMEFNKVVDVITANGSKVRYRIVHGWYDSRRASDSDEQYETNIWGREHISSRGYSNGDEILIHGHTPTASYDYMMNSDMNTHRPGLIGYRPNCINVDGGCCYFKDFPQYLCMLCAICLETLEEIYPYTLKERVIQSGVIECVPVYDKTDKNRKDMENRIC